MRWFVCILLFLPTMVLAQETYHVSALSATVHSMPNATSAVQARLKKGDELKYLKLMESGDWAKVQVQGKIGYIDINAISSGPYEQKVKQATSSKYHVSVFQTAIYATKKFSGKKLKTLSQNDIVQVLGESDEWGKVKINNAIGYVYMEHLTEGLPKKEKKEKVVKTETYTTKYSVKVHSKPSKSSPVRKTISKDNTVEVLEVVNGNWAKIRLEKSFGYIELIGLEKQKATASSGSSGGGGNPHNQGKSKYPKKFGAFCRDGSTDFNVGPKTCKNGNGVKMWIYTEPK